MHWWGNRGGISKTIKPKSDFIVSAHHRCQHPTGPPGGEGETERRWALCMCVCVCEREVLVGGEGVRVVGGAAGAQLVRTTWKFSLPGA